MLMTLLTEVSLIFIISDVLWPRGDAQRAPLRYFGKVIVKYSAQNSAGMSCGGGELRCQLLSICSSLRGNLRLDRGWVLNPDKLRHFCVRVSAPWVGRFVQHS